MKKQISKPDCVSVTVCEVESSCSSAFGVVVVEREREREYLSMRPY